LNSPERTVGEAGAIYISPGEKRTKQGGGGEYTKTPKRGD
jgi:hypothetical protein